MSMTVDWKGREQFAQNLLELSREMPAEVAAALYKEAQIEMTEAKRRTPVDTGALRNSGQVSKPKVEPDGITVKLSFGSPLSQWKVSERDGSIHIPEHYAIHVHEDLGAFHKVGQAKYLESTINESGRYLPARIAKRVKDYLAKPRKR
jgi:hypothetical protein